MVLLTEDIWSFNLDAALCEISGQRREYALRYRTELDRRLCVRAYLLLCEGLRRVYGITSMPLFKFGKYGKPMLVGYPDIHFSISHCPEAVICVLEDNPVGVDIELVSNFDEQVARYVMNQEEWSQIESSSCPDVEFACLWTRKEAVLKQTGFGISDNLKEVLTTHPLPVDTFISQNRRYVYSICKGLLEFGVK